jgi:hypothetical protein
MRNLFCFILFTALTVILDFPASGQMRGPMRDMFQGQPPPPGAVTVLGRSVFGAIDNGFGSSLALLIGSDDQTVRQELGLTDTEANSIRLLRAQMLLNAPKYANRFKTMTDENRQEIQQDLSRDLGRITAALDNALAPERKAKAQKFVFQTLGGLDSPMINLSSMETLNLSDKQKEKMQSVFDEMRDERVAQMEKFLGMAEKVVTAGGPQNLTPAEREELDKTRRELESQSFATAKKLADRLRQHLTPAQLELEKQLIASRPSFLPKLPRQMSTAENTPGKSGGVYTPGADSWRPGQDVPNQLPERRQGNFPRKKETE